PKRLFYVAELHVHDLRTYGIHVIANPIKGNPGHALIPHMNSENRKLDKVREWAELLAVSLVYNILGPYSA
ncbi:hypothetical protein MNBD_PLANCTO02-2449, partial [hydrothermal vent metagenome]